jgi:O-antigen ligase
MRTRLEDFAATLGKNLPTYLCVLFAIALQIQATLFSSETYLGLRINMAELLLPFAALAILLSLLFKKSQWPDWPIKSFYAWLAILTGVLALALLNAHITMSEISRWALVNKFCGWLVLLGLMGTGGWIAANASRENLEKFLKIFLYFFGVVMLGDLSLNAFQAFAFGEKIIPLTTHIIFPAEGFMKNRNAYALLFLTALSFVTCFYRSGMILPKWYAPAFYFFIPFFLMFNGSRAMIIALCIILPLFIILNKRVIQLLAFAAMGAAIFWGMYQHRWDTLAIFRVSPVETISAFQQEDNLNDIAGKTSYPGDSMRLTILNDALELFKERPLLGSGLGSMLLYQKDKHGEMINLIDSTPIWLTVETGLIGAALFLIFYILVIRALWRGAGIDDPWSKDMRFALLFCLLAFTIMCCFHEILYTRHMWFLIGMGLALPLKTHRPG